jgi:hypothetical protein
VFYPALGPHRKMHGSMSPEERVIYSGIVALAAVWFWLWSIVDTSLGEPGRFRTASKGIWVALCVVLPVLGGAVYLIVGRNFTRPRANTDSEGWN